MGSNDPPALFFIHWSDMVLDSYVLSYIHAFLHLTDSHISRVGSMAGCNPLAIMLQHYRPD
jgi:hypothetical protein